MPKIKIVSGYIPIPQLRNATPETFLERGLHMTDAVHAGGLETHLFHATKLEDCWAYKFVREEMMQGRAIMPSSPTMPDRFPDDGTHIKSCIIMHQKQEWMCQAAIADPEPDVFVWIDYGVLKQQGMSEEVITRFCERLRARACFPCVEAPGIRPEPGPVDNTGSCDRFCGSVVIEPRDKLFRLARAMKARTMEFIRKTHTINIESNVLAEVEHALTVPIRWYPAGWGAPMFDNLPPS